MAQDKELTLGTEVPDQLIVLAFLCFYLTDVQGKTPCLSR